MADKTSEWRPGPTVCRCCLAEGCYKDISTEYFWMGKREVYAEMLAETFSVSIAYSKSGGPNSNSRLICEPCISRLRDASDFKKQVQECEKTFMQYLDPGSSSTTLESEVQTSSTDKRVKVEQVKIERQFSDDEFDSRDFGDDDDDDDMDQPLTTFASKEPKKETVNLMELLASPQLSVKRKAPAQTKTVSVKKVKVIKKDARGKPTTSKAAQKNEDKKKKGSVQKSDSTMTIRDDDGTDVTLTVLKTPISLGTLKPENRKNTTQNIREEPKNINKMLVLKEPLSLDRIDWDNLTEVTFNVKTVEERYVCKQKKRDKESKEWIRSSMSIFDNTYTYPFVHTGGRYKCFVCRKTFFETNSLRDHTLEHKSEDLEKELQTKQSDVNIKIDVSNAQCKLCDLKFGGYKELKLHLVEHGLAVNLTEDNLIPFKLNSDVFECQVCGEGFLKLRLLIVHMSCHYNNYSCEICGSAFMSLRLLKRHLQCHQTGNFPCDKCDKAFSSATKRTLHVRGVHLKLLPRRCPICPERFNSNYQRTKHLRIAHNHSTGLYRCETCSREYDLKYHLLLHIRSVHLRERNQECHVCHSRFFSKYCLSRHMVVHTGEKGFKCDTCGKGFSRRKNLLEHSRTHEVQTCAACGLQFVDHSNLIAHVSNVHGTL